MQRTPWIIYAMIVGLLLSGTAVQAQQMEHVSGGTGIPGEGLEQTDSGIVSHEPQVSGSAVAAGGGAISSYSGRGSLSMPRPVPANPGAGAGGASATEAALWSVWALPFAERSRDKQMRAFPFYAVMEVFALFPDVGSLPYQTLSVAWGNHPRWFGVTRELWCGC